jgi:hypothetical protein
MRKFAVETATAVPISVGFGAAPVTLRQAQGEGSARTNRLSKTKGLARALILSLSKDDGRLALRRAKFI